MAVALDTLDTLDTLETALLAAETFDCLLLALLALPTLDLDTTELSTDDVLSLLFCPFRPIYETSVITAPMNFLK